MVLQPPLQFWNGGVVAGGRIDRDQTTAVRLALRSAGSMSSGSGRRV